MYKVFFESVIKGNDTYNLANLEILIFIEILHTCR